MDKKKEDVLLRKLKCKILATISRFKFTKSRIFSHLHVIVMEMSLEEDALLVSFFFFALMSLMYDKRRVGHMTHVS